MRKLLTHSFFKRRTIPVARDLLGKYIVHVSRGHEYALMITEVEAYDGPNDLASHASRGRTPRTTIMFGKAGRFYIYFTYGMHWLINIVTGNKEYPAAVLFRAGIAHDPKTGKEILIKGPARLTTWLHIDGTHNGAIASRKTGLWLEDRGVTIPRSRILATKRIGVAYAGPLWSAKKYNFQVIHRTP
jgi:DNA-3-methyladenine glycosylase